MTPTILHHPSSPGSKGLLLKEATIEQAALKAGFFGPQASGKTTTATLLAIGIAKRFHNSAPIAFMDTEAGSDFVKPICDAEGVPLLVVKSRAFADMKAVIVEAEKRGCCALIVDSYTHPWKELCDSFKRKSNRQRLEFHHMDALKSAWQTWTDLMLNSPLHVLLCGRLGYVWDQEEEVVDGKTERTLVKLGTKMKSEADAGYEPSLLVEMEAIQEAEARVRKTRAKRGSINHHCYVLKDRWRTLNGRTFTFRDLNAYEPGDYETVFKAFLPHVEKLAIGSVQRAVDPTRTSAGEFTDNGQSASQQLQTQKQIVVEELEGTFRAIWPSETVFEKSIRSEARQALFNTRSWTRVQNEPVEILEHGLLVLQVVEGVLKGKFGPVSLPEKPEDITRIIASAQQVVRDQARAAEEVAHL